MPAGGGGVERAAPASAQHVSASFARRGCRSFGSLWRLNRRCPSIPGLGSANDARSRVSADDTDDVKGHPCERVEASSNAPCAQVESGLAQSCFGHVALVCPPAE